MKLRKRLYILHRWLGLIISLQLLAWSTGGLLFSILELSAVRGEDNIPEVAHESLDPAQITISTSQAIVSATELLGGPLEIGRIDLRPRAGSPTYFLRDTDGLMLATVDAQTGQVNTLLTPDDASDLAQAGFTPESDVLAVELLENDLPGEARGRDLPLYRVMLDHTTNPRLYLDAISGDIVARRNDKWRLFDFFWMLHIMDYKERDDFNHPLLTAASALAVLTALSGLGLWGWRAKSSLHRRRLRIQRARA